MPEEQIRSQQWVEKIELLVGQAQAISDPVARNVTIDLLRAVLEFHAAGLERVLDMIFESGPAGAATIDKIAADQLAGSLLLLHNLHPDDLETRLNRAVERLQDMFASLGANLSLVALEPGPGGDRREVGAGTGLGIALAPQLGRGSVQEVQLEGLELETLRRNITTVEG